MEAINTMLRERMEAKFARKFDEADALLQRLHEKYGVSVNDGSKAWRADGQSFQRQFKRVGPAIPAPGGGEEDEAKVEAQVLALIAERMAARKDRNYRYADQIMADLLQMYGVVLVDADYTYRYVGDGHDGGYGEGGGYGRRADVDASQGHDYMREVGCDAELSAEALSEINDLLAKRLARRRRASLTRPMPCRRCYGNAALASTIKPGRGGSNELQRLQYVLVLVLDGVSSEPGEVRAEMLELKCRVETSNVGTFGGNVRLRRTEIGPRDESCPDRTTESKHEI